MTAPDLPPWAAYAVAVLVVAGAAMALTGALGLLRFRTFYDRLHPPTLGSSSATLLIVAGSILCFSVLRSRLSVHEVLIALFVTVTTPVTFMLLARAALYRDRAEANRLAPDLGVNGEDPGPEAGSPDKGPALAPPDP
jgi:multicomponent K+:H+ antiporter subunit G